MVNGIVIANGTSQPKPKPRVDSKESSSTSAQEPQQSNTALPTTPKNKNTSVIPSSPAKDKVKGDIQPTTTNEKDQKLHSTPSPTSIKAQRKKEQITAKKLTGAGNLTPACSIPPPKMQALRANGPQLIPVQIGPNKMAWLPAHPFPVNLHQFPGMHPAGWPSMAPHSLHAPQQHAPAQQGPSYRGPPHRAPPQRGPAQHVNKANSVSNGSWQATGENTVHGPKAVFHKHGPQNPTRHNQQQSTGDNQALTKNRARTGSTWSGRSSGGSTVRQSTYGNAKNGSWHNGNGNGNGNGKQRRFTNKNGGGYYQETPRMASAPHMALAHPQHSAMNHPNLYGSPPNFQAWNSGQLGAPGATSPSKVLAWIEDEHEHEHCVNAAKYQSEDPRIHKYDPCPCKNCQSRDRSIFVNGFYHDGLRTMKNVEDLFRQFGRIVNTWEKNNTLHFR